MSVIYTVINNKGGTGKTTTVLNLGAALAQRKKRTLLIDLDAQGNLTSAAGISGEFTCIGEVLLGEATPEEAIVSTEGIDLLPASSRLLEHERQLETEPGRELALKEKIQPLLERYSRVIIDCPPSLSTLALNSLVAAHRFIVPMQAENFAYIGLDRILRTAQVVKQRLNPDLELAGVLFVKLNPRTNFSKAIISNLTQNPLVGDRLFDTYIRQDIALMESAAFNQNIFQYAPKSRGSEDYSTLAKELAKLEKKWGLQ